MKITFNKISFLLMGDAGIEAENSLLSSSYNLDSDILKIGHHGSSSASSAGFLAKVTPAISIIEVGKGNDYGHPTKKTLSALQNTGSKIYRTDTSGNIVVTTDGQSYSVTTEKQPSRNTASTTPKGTSSAATWTSGGTASSTTATTTAALSSDGPFVGSAKSDKYHYSSCSAAQKIKSANLVTFSSSADARAQGYVPCGICHPP